MERDSEPAPVEGQRHPTAPRLRTVVCLLGLTFATGIVDALSWLGLDGVFTANMSGNVLIVGMGLAGGQPANWLASMIALACFVAGAAVCGVLQRHRPPGWTGFTTLVFSGVGVCVLAVGIVTLLSPPARSSANTLVVTGVLAAAMGVQGAEALRLAVPQIITVAVSSTVVGLGVSLFLGARSGPAGGRLTRLAAVVLLGGGAFVGAHLLDLTFGVGLILAGVIALAMAAVGRVSTRSG